MSQKNVKRLFTQFQPQSYEIELTIDPDAMKFSGNVQITGNKAGRPSKRITLHQKNLKITSGAITLLDKKGEMPVELSRINKQSAFEEVRIHSNQMIYPGRYRVYLEFAGEITKNMDGIYPCFFKNGGKDKKLIATQFESHHARKVFPCVDEPEAKATFDLTLIAPKNGFVISNTPEKKTINMPGFRKTSFETTPKMSSYLLAFVWGEMEYKEIKTKSGITLRTYATPDNVQHTAFALDFAAKCLDFYNDYFGIPYPLLKCDFIALPDFASGAMENWGCITFREQTLLVDPAKTALATRQHVAMVIAHELAHQWFGNLVTMRWWTDLWLNEGFASWIEFMAVDKIYPEWQMWTQFAVDEQQQAFKLDALENTHPIEVPIRHPDEIQSIFDAISYSKGASVIHMLHSYLGDSDFQSGLKHYLTKYSYGNADTEDLWRALGDVSGKDVSEFMKPWTKQPGFPLLNVTVKNNKISLKQTKFNMLPSQNIDPGCVWPIPLLSNQAGLPERLADDKNTINIKPANNLRFNDNQAGFYRVTYNPQHLHSLGHLIRVGKLDALDRVGLLSDVFEAAKTGHVATTDAFEFLENFSDESDYAVWDIIAGCLGSLKLVMGDDDLRETIKPYIRQLVSEQLNKLGWNKKAKEGHFDRLLRPMILGMAASADHPKTVQKCRKLFDKLGDTTDPSSILDPDIRSVVFGTIARIGDESDFRKLVKLHNSSDSSEERVTLSAAITGFHKPSLIKESLAIIQSGQVRPQDIPYWIAYSFTNRHAKADAWHWVQQNWAWLEKTLGTDLSFYRVPIYVARVQSDISFTKEYTKFFEPRLNPSLERSYRQGLEIIAWQAAWKERDYKLTLAYLSKFK